MIKHLKVILEDLILLLSIVIVVSYIYPYGYIGKCKVPSFFNPLGISDNSCSIDDPIEAPHYLFFISVDLLVPFIFAYILFFLSSLKDTRMKIESNKSIKIVKNFIILYIILTVLSYLLAPKNCKYEECDLIGYTNSSPHYIGLSLDSLAIVLISCGIWYYLKREIDKRIRTNLVKK